MKGLLALVSIALFAGPVSGDGFVEVRTEHYILSTRQYAPIGAEVEVCRATYCDDDDRFMTVDDGRGRFVGGVAIDFSEPLWILVHKTGFVPELQLLSANHDTEQIVTVALLTERDFIRQYGWDLLLRRLWMIQAMFGFVDGGEHLPRREVARWQQQVDEMILSVAAQIQERDE